MVIRRTKSRDIERSEERLRLAQRAAQIGTWEWDPGRHTRTLSPELHRMFGTTADDPAHADVWASRLHPDDRHNVWEYMEQAQQTGNVEFEYRYYHPELGLRWFYCKGARL